MAKSYLLGQASNGCEVNPSFSNVGLHGCWEWSPLSLLRSTSGGLAPEGVTNQPGSAFRSWVDPTAGLRGVGSLPVRVIGPRSGS
ncbi:hypothetical protein V6N13_015183 [Hibiscus sabdariffa]|uniref:Uncharacterized protein n=1 Tax=Hibiscus sabdariffa TaxID=183260 RepID=A0ABR2B7U3_9ROSI